MFKLLDLHKSKQLLFNRSNSQLLEILKPVLSKGCLSGQIIESHNSKNIFNLQIVWLPKKAEHLIIFYQSEKNEGRIKWINMIL